VGHVRLGKLPASRKWQGVVELLSVGGATTSSIAEASAEAAEASLGGASGDRSIGHAFWLLTQLPLAAREEDFSRELERLGLDVGPGGPTLFALGTALNVALEATSWGDKGRTDLGAMARQSVVETILSLAGESAPKLFETTANDVKVALAGFGRSDRFPILARDFFSRLCRRSLEYFLSRELSNHVGAGRQFASIQEHSEFSAALDLHCRQASRIIDDFAGDWYGKRLRDQTPLSQTDATAFAAVAFKKVRAELKRRRSSDA
jgi:hypothetical protein